MLQAAALQYSFLSSDDVPLVVRHETGQNYAIASGMVGYVQTVDQLECVFRFLHENLYFYHLC